MSNRRDWVSLTIVGGILILIVFVLVRMLFPPDPVDITIVSSPETDAMSAATALAMGERMGQSAEWTIATILVIGTALVGLNWYQSDRRYQRDMDELNERIATAELTLHQTLALITYKQVADNLGSPDQSGFVGRCVDQFRRTKEESVRRLIAVMLAGWVVQLETTDPTRVISADVSALKVFLPELQDHFPDQGKIVKDALPKVATNYPRIPDLDQPEQPDSAPALRT